MKTLFFYGTMRHVALLEYVMGRAAGALDIAQAVLPAYAVMAAQDGPFPVLVPDAASNAQGVVVHGLSDTDIARLNYYEAGFDYDLRSLTLQGGEIADVYVPTPDVRATDTAWDFSAWVRDWAELSLMAAQEVMDGFGIVAPDVVAARFPQIRARAWSRMMAHNGRHGAGVMDGRVEIINRRRAHTSFYGFDELQIRHETFNGGMSAVLDRSVFVSCDASIVLPYDPVRDLVLLVEQVRLGPIGRYDPVVWQLEPIAGLIDAGEMPDAAAHREAQEEAGLSFDHLEPVGECYASPGATTEFFNLFVGLCALPDTASRIGGEPSEGENIRTHVLTFDALLAMAEARKTANAPLTLLTYWLAVHRDRLRASHVD